MYADYFNIDTDCNWKITENTRFNLICEVVGDDSTAMCDQVHTKILPSDPGVPFCCGSEVPEPAEKSLTGQFERRDAGGSIKVGAFFKNVFI